MLSTLGLLPLLGLKGQAGAGMMEELRKWKPVLVELQPQPEHSSKAAMERRKGYPDLSSLPPLSLLLPFNPLLVLPIAQTNWKQEDKKV